MPEQTPGKTRPTGRADTAEMAAWGVGGAVGGAVGSMAGPVGTVVGAAAGGALADEAVENAQGATPETKKALQNTVNRATDAVDGKSQDTGGDVR